MKQLPITTAESSQQSVVEKFVIIKKV